MATRGNWVPLINQGVQWDERGNPFYNTSDGQKDYIPPISAAQYRDDPRMLSWATSKGATIGYEGTGADTKVTGITNNSVPGGGFFHQRGQWNSETGNYDTPLDWGNILSAVIAGTITGGVAIAALGGGAPAAAAVNTALATGSAAEGAAAGAAAGAGIGIGETAATVGLASGVGLPGAVAAPLALGAGAPIAAAASGGVGLGETGAAGLTSGVGLPGATAIPTVGDLATVGSSIPGMAEGAMPTAGSSASGWEKALDAADQVGSLVSGITKGAGETQYNNNLLEAQANSSNIAGRQAYENELQNRSHTEATERNRALANIYMGSRVQNPTRSPFNKTPATQYSQEYLQALRDLTAQGSQQLKTPARYGTPAMPELDPYVPYVPNTQQSGAQRAGNILAPTLGAISAIGRIYKAVR